MQANIDTVTVDQRTRPICNNPGLRLGNARRPQSVRQRARQLQHFLLNRLCHRIDPRPDHPDEGSALAVFALLRNHVGVVGALVSLAASLQKQR